MRFEDEAIILGKKRISDSSCIVFFLTKNHGLYKGFCRINKTNSSAVQDGAMVKAFWSARLSDHLGSVRFELLSSTLSFIMFSKLKIYALGSACALLINLLCEREVSDGIYDLLCDFLNSLKVNGDANKWMFFYIKLELNLLRLLGFGLDLRSVDYKRKKHLGYISSKDGSFSLSISHEYYAKIFFKVPRSFFYEEFSDFYDGLLITGYFLNKHCLIPHGKSFPEVRIMMCNDIKCTIT